MQCECQKTAFIIIPVGFVPCDVPLLHECGPPKQRALPPPLQHMAARQRTPSHSSHKVTTILYRSSSWHLRQPLRPHIRATIYAHTYAPQGASERLSLQLKTSNHDSIAGRPSRDIRHSPYITVRIICPVAHCPYCKVRPGQSLLNRPC
jgi:hypothetical protein